MILTGHTLVARMYDDKELRQYEVAELDGALYVREARAGLGGWSAIHYSLNPDLDTYLQRCAGNFGWRVERLDGVPREVRA